MDAGRLIDGTNLTSNSGQFLNIAIRDPIRSQDNFGSYISYHIESNSNITGYIFGDVSVVRRYSDFTWLSTELSNYCPGVILPALPEKQTIGRFTPEFVESRRRALERFLIRIAAHKELNIAPQFIAFLQADDLALKDMKEKYTISVTKMGASALSWLEGRVNKISTGNVCNSTNNYSLNQV